MTTLTGQTRHGTGRGFTLVELLLATVLLLLLLSAAIFSFSTFQHGAELNEGAAQLEGLIRFARAHAANTGRQVQINFEEEVDGETTASLGGIRVLWEPDPLGDPGTFVDLPEAAPIVRSVTELVEVRNVQWIEPGTDPGSSVVPGDAETLDYWGDEFIEVFPPITFHPDGSSDSAEITLVSRAADDLRRVAVRLVGLTGAIHRRVVVEESETELEEQDADKAHGRQQPGSRETPPPVTVPAALTSPSSMEEGTSE